MTLDEKLEAALQQYYGDPHVTIAESIAAIKQAVREELPAKNKIGRVMRAFDEGYNAAINDMKQKLQ